MLPRRLLPFCSRAAGRPRSRLVTLLLITLAGMPVVAGAQDRLVFPDNHIQEGKVLGVTPEGQVQISMATAGGGTGQLSFNIHLLSRVEVAAPPEFQTGLAAYQAGNWDKALAALKPLAGKFRGLPVDWMAQTAAVLGDIYLEKKDVASAEAAYNDFRKLYPAGAGGSVRATVGQARVAFAKNNTTAAKQQLAPVALEAMKNPALVSRADGIAYGQAFYLLGQMAEKEGSFQTALEDYLRTTTLFYQDTATASAAGKSADALRAAHKDLTVP